MGKARRRAHFEPRNLWVHNGRALSSVSNSTQFRARAKVLYESVAADIKARCAQAFGIKDPVDMKIQNGLKDDLACVVRTDLEGAEALAQFFLADGRKKGFTLAVRFLENYLKANEDEIPLSQDEALSFPDVRNAVAVNIERFWQNNLIAPKTVKQGVTKLEAISQDPEKDELQFTDDWVRTIPSRAGLAYFLSKIAIGVDPQSGSIGFGPGGSNLKSTGVFELKRNGNRIAVTVTATHVWSDKGFEFEPNDPFYEESRVLERHKKAKPFKWKAEWVDIITGELEIVDPFTPNATRRRIGFDAMPPVDVFAP